MADEKRVGKRLSLLFAGAGMGLLLMGGYFTVVRAGIPYQDPTPALTARWSTFLEAGECCLSVGAVLLVISLVIKLAGKLLQKHVKEQL